MCSQIKTLVEEPMSEEDAHFMKRKAKFNHWLKALPEPEYKKYHGKWIKWYDHEKEPQVFFETQVKAADAQPHGKGKIGTGFLVMEVNRNPSIDKPIRDEAKQKAESHSTATATEPKEDAMVVNSLKQDPFRPDLSTEAKRQAFDASVKACLARAKEINASAKKSGNFGVEAATKMSAATQPKEDETDPLEVFIPEPMVVNEPKLKAALATAIKSTKAWIYNNVKGWRLELNILNQHPELEELVYLMNCETVRRSTFDIMSWEKEFQLYLQTVDAATAAFVERMKTNKSAACVQQDWIEHRQLLASVYLTNPASFK